MSKKSFIAGLAAGVMLMCMLFFGYSAYSARVRWEGLPNPDSKVAEIIDMLDRYSIIPFEREALLTSMYRGLLEGVGDPYTQYFDQPALEAFRIRTEGVFAGIGVMSFMDDETKSLTIGEVFARSPAYAAGLLSGDRIVAVEGECMLGQPIGYITDLIRGPVNTPVLLTIIRLEEETERTFDINIVRALVEIPTVTSELLPNNVGYIRIDGFDRVTFSQFEKALENLTDAGIQSLIVDVRNNPGGLMPVVVQITNLLVPEGIITYTEQADGRREYHNATAEYLGLPLVVLVNERSASASEILSAAVQDTGAGIVIGTQTFGKGIVQNLMYLSDGNAIKMTVAKYFTPNGVSIHGIGVTPNILVEMDEKLSRQISIIDRADDVQLQAALEALNRFPTRR